jgi:transcriptional regulator with XRE-family HTH domain
MHVDNDLVELRAAAARLEGDPLFMASTLAHYRTELRLNDQQLAKALGCNVEALTSLALCRTPRVEDEKLFLSDVQAIAKYVGCDWTELAKVIRTAQSIETLKRFTGAPTDQLLKAARDKHGDHEDPDKSKSRKR